jgi:UDP-N-acetylmuramate--alanine ligase
MKIYFIGIGGIGMSGLADYMLSKNNIVCGSDSVSSVITDRLAEKGAMIYTEHNEHNITDDIELVVYSSEINFSNH